MLKYVFIAAFLFHATTSGLYQLQKSWLDDIDGPKFLRGAKEQIQEDKEVDDFLNHLERVARDEIFTTATSVKEKIICETTAHPDGINTTKWDKNKPAIGAQPYVCAPHATIVELERPDDGFTRLPSMVLLHRCMGDCPGTQELQNCTVTNQEEVMLKVHDYSQSQSSFKNVTVYNHTKCACACKTRKSDCDENTQDYSSAFCGCNCKQHLRNSCNSTIQRYNSKTCKCECKSAQKHCDSNSNHEWNPKICDCDCSQRVKDRCIRKGKALNKSRCECECPKPLPVCPVGTSFLKYNCTCVDTSVGAK